MSLRALLPGLVLFLLLAASRLQAQTVYVTETGKKYHAKNCSLAKTGKKGMDLSEARKQGYEPCKQCKAEPAATEPKKTTPEKTAPKSGKS